MSLCVSVTLVVFWFCKERIGEGFLLSPGILLLVCLWPLKVPCHHPLSLWWAGLHTCWAFCGHSELASPSGFVVTCHVWLCSTCLEIKQSNPHGKAYAFTNVRKREGKHLSKHYQSIRVGKPLMQMLLTKGRFFQLDSIRKMHVSQMQGSQTQGSAIVQQTPVIFNVLNTCKSKNH